MSIQVTTGKPRTGSEPDQSKPVPVQKNTAGLNPLLNRTKVPDNASVNTKAIDDNKAEEHGRNDAYKPNQDKTRLSVDYSIPTLEEIALPGNPPSQPGSIKPVSPAINNPLLKAALEKKNRLEITPELIDKLAAELHETLIPEIEKSVKFAFNNALASALDQASRVAQATISKRVSILLPELLKRHLEDIAQNGPDKD